jgi:hypothetical protein
MLLVESDGRNYMRKVFLALIPPLKQQASVLLYWEAAIEKE